MANTLEPYFDTVEKSILRISRTKFTQVLYDEFEKKLDIVLQKLGSNAFTKTVRRLLPKVYLGHSGSARNSNIPVWGVYVGTSTLLGGIVVDIIRCSPDSSADLLKLIKENYDLLQERSKLTRTVTESALEKINKIESQINKNSIVIANLIDYERVAEAIYYTFIRYIVAEVDKGSSGKLFELALELFKKILLQSFGKVINLENKPLFNAAVDYVFTVAFTNMRPSEVLTNVGRRYGKEIYDILANTHINQFRTMNDITSVLSILKIANITPIAFNSVLSKRYGDDVVAILHSTYDYYIAWATVTAHNSILFDMGPIDKDIQSQIETIVLNFKSRVRGI